VRSCAIFSGAMIGRCVSLSEEGSYLRLIDVVYHSTLGLHPAPNILHHTPCTLHPTPCLPERVEGCATRPSGRVQP